MGPGKSYLYLTLDGRVILGFWIESTKDGGFCFGPLMRKGDVHLTVLAGQGKFRYHVKHKGVKEPPDECPIGRQVSMRLVDERIQEMVTKRLETYHGNRACWVFTRARWKRIQALLPKVDVKGNLHVPLELVFAEFDMDFSKRRIWRKARIRYLLSMEPYFGFLEDRCKVRLVKPIAKDTMLAWPLSKADEIQQFIGNIMGFEEFVDYLANTDEGKKLLAGTRKNIKQLSSPS